MPRLCSLPRIANGARWVGGVLFWVGAAGAQVPLDGLQPLLSRPGREPFAGGLVVPAQGLLAPRLKTLPRAVALPIGARHAVIRAPQSELSRWLRAESGR